VTAGGIITAAKKIRTRTGSQMMFATVDDLEGAVEIVVFEKALANVESALGADEIVLVRGRVDHKEAGKVCIIVQDVDKFDPSEAEIEKAKAQVAKIAAQRPSAVKRRVDAAQLPANVIDDLRELFERYPGDMEFVLIMQTRTGERRLKFGDGYKVKGGDAGFKAELNSLLPAMTVSAAA
jgi:DNA polymerase-3 subunit alpha